MRIERFTAESDADDDSNPANDADIAYAYDALGRRIQTTRAGVTTYHFHSVGWQVIEDRIRPAGNAAAVKDLPVAAQYVWSPHYVDELILIDRISTASRDGGCTTTRRAMTFAPQLRPRCALLIAGAQRRAIG